MIILPFFRLVLLLFAVLMAQVTVIEDDQIDLIVSHPTEPYVVEANCDTITVTPTVETSVLIYVHRQGEVISAIGEEFIYDQPTTRAVLLINRTEGKWDYHITVIVNEHSQVSNTGGILACDE